MDQPVVFIDKRYLNNMCQLHKKLYMALKQLLVLGFCTSSLVLVAIPLIALCLYNSFLMVAYRFSHGCIILLVYDCLCP